jgi:hypothetical protein
MIPGFRRTGFLLVMKFTQIYGPNIPTMCVESLDYPPWADRAVAREVQRLRLGLQASAAEALTL